MFFFRLIWTAIRSLETHFLRSLLATVGVLIGVGSVVACMSIIEGATGRILRDLKSMGSNLIFVQPETAYVEGRRVGVAQTLRLDDMKALEQDLSEDISSVAPMAIDSAPVKYFQKSDTFTIVATSNRYFEMNEYKAAEGRGISASDAQDEMAMICCLGSKVAEKLFGGMQPVGQTVKIKNGAYRVIGVMEARGNVGFMDADRTVYLPVRAALRRYFSREWLNFLTVAAAKDVDVNALKLLIQQHLRLRHNIRIGQRDDFEVSTLEETVRNFGYVNMILQVVFYAIAGISLVVGGIGIMNIMLVSVTERTREIGVRMAVGARREDILLQFLFEALTVSSLGGATGLLLGIMLADLIDKVLEGLLHTEITPSVVIVALATTTIVGVASGIYPAFKASRLDPVEALRFE